jgi:formylglycine-generating enzyme required for sulfatase activity
MAMTRDAASVLRLVQIPGATFTMGDRFGDGFPQELPVHEVRIAPFWIARCCVTAREYLDFIEQAGSDFDELWCDFINPCFILRTANKYRLCAGAEDYPMVQVSFVGAVAYCNWLSRKHGLDSVYELKTLEADLSRNGFRLPKEAEWEYACGGPQQYPYGYGPAFAPERVCYGESTASALPHRAGERRVGGFSPLVLGPVPVGTLPPNDFGLHEMLGNVNEWCHDRYGPYSPQPADNPSGAAAGSFRVVRGGSFLADARSMRKSFRHGIHYQSKCMIDGFRIARNA